MSVLSRRRLAIYAAEQLAAGRPAAGLAKELTATLAASKKLKDVQLLIGDINYELENRGLLAQASVTTATPLSSDLRKALLSQIKKLSGVNQASLSEQIDKKVIGGIRIDTAQHSWDKTIVRKLADIKGGIK